MYSLVGPEEDIVQITFAPEKHERLQKQLKQLSKNLQIIKLQQQDFQYNTMFEDYFTAKHSMFFFSSESPLVAAGTNFQKRVWHHSRAIPYGSDITYQGLAKLAGSPKGSRAVGMACGANQIALMIPCHRVVAVNGLGGFAGGVNIKKDLLAHEQSAKNSRMNRS